MPLSLSAVLLSTQLIVVADRIPTLDVKPGCRESTVPNCLDMEQSARDELIKAWPQFTAQEKARCAQEEKQAGPPSYVGWLTCLRINANARKDPKAAASIPTYAAMEAGRRRVNIRDVSRLTGQCGCRRRASRNHLLNKRLLVVLSGHGEPLWQKHLRRWTSCSTTPSKTFILPRRRF